MKFISLESRKNKTLEKGDFLILGLQRYFTWIFPYLMIVGTWDSDTEKSEMLCPLNYEFVRVCIKDHDCDGRLNGMSNSEVRCLFYEMLSGALRTVRHYGAFHLSKLLFILCIREYILYIITQRIWLSLDVTMNSNRTHKANYVDLLL